MNLYAIDTGTFKLDGGAMFGVVPKVIWQKTNPADDRNLIDMAMRCLLIEDGNRLFLIDNGIGHKYDTKFQGLYAIDHSVTLDSSLAKHGFSRSDVTDLILTHLHFDHCGGSTYFNTDKNRYEVAFPNAKIYLQKDHLALAQKPNAREKASFFKENIEPLAESGQLVLLEGNTKLSDAISLEVVNGHTIGQQLPVVRYQDKTILYAADLFPTYGHIPLPYVMGYDTQPLVTLDERAGYLKRLTEQNIILFYEHDPYNECGLVQVDEKGRYSSGETFPLTNVL
jgi:glyoxylase-like metal-dependent hydrolase (beta-lactamase superfamily II)